MNSSTSLFGILSFLFFFLIITPLSAQSITLSTQAQVNAYAGGNEVNGDLIIQGNDINDLSPLSGITTITGRLAILSCPILQDLSGLSGVTTVEDDLTINDNELLPNLNGLQNISSTLNQLVITNNNNLQNVDGLTGITEIIIDLKIGENPLLNNINGLSNISGRVQNINIDFNDVLTSIAPLNNIIGATKIGILKNDLLPNLNGLNNIAGRISEIFIGGNILLTNLDELGNISGLTSMIIQDNPLLSDFCGLAYAISNSNPANINVLISGNPSGPTTTSEILADCFPEGCAGYLALTTQVEVDALAGCDTIYGFLSLSGSDITDLSSLSSLVSIEGSMELNQLPNLNTLNGLQNLTSVRGDLNVFECQNLQNLSGLNNLETVEGFIAIVDNVNLLDLAGLESLSDVSELVVIGNGMLSNLDALSNLTTISSFLLILNNGSLTNINGLENVTGTIGSIEISNEDLLTSLSPLQGLNINFQLTITDNEALSSLDGLEGLSGDVSGAIIASNPSLISIEALAGMTSASNILVISDNNQLSNCCPIADLLESGNINNLFIDGSQLACSSVSNVVSVCNGGGVTCDQLPIFTNQAQIDNFELCDTIIGDLTINGTNSNISNLNNFASVTVVTGRLTIRNIDNLSALTGFENLQSVGDLELFTLPNVSTLNALSNLNNISDRLTIERLNSIQNLSGLDNITNLNRLDILRNDLLLNLDGLNLQGSISRVSVGQNDELLNIDAFGNITEINDFLSISGNPKLNECCAINPLFQNNTFPSFTNIFNNAANCVDQNALVENCNANNGPVDLSVDISVDNDVLNIYSSYTYNVTVTNNSTAIATNVFVDLKIPNGMAYSSDNDNTFPGYDDWIGEWRILLIAPGESRTLELVLFSLTESVPISLYGQIKSADQADSDSTPNNTPCCTPVEDDEAVSTVSPEGTVLLAADLELTASVDQTVISEGDTVTINLQLTNWGPDVASAIVVDFSFPGFQLLSGATTTGGVIFTGDFWSIPEMLSGITYNATFKLRVFPGQNNPLINGIYTMLFQVDTGVPNDPDSTPGNGFCPDPRQGNCVAMEDDEAVITFIKADNNDTTPPSVTLSSNNGVVNGPFNVNVVFSESVSGLMASDFIINNATASGLSGNGATYSLQLTPTTPGIVSVSLPADVVTDLAGNNNLASNSAQVTYTIDNGGDGVDLALTMSVDVMEPAIYSEVTFTLNLTNDGMTDATGVTVLFPFPEELAYVSEDTDFGAFDVFLRTWNVGNVPAGTTATLNLTLFTLTDEAILAYAQVQTINEPDEDSTPGNWTCDLTLAIPCIPNEDDEATFTLNVPNVNPGPTVSLSTTSTNVDIPFTININFSDFVTGFMASDLSINNATASDLFGNGTSYTALITPINPGVVSIILPSNRANDSDGNPNQISNNLSVNYNPISSNGLDLELAFTTDETGFTLYDEITVTLTLTNNGTEGATNLVVEYPKPVNGAFVAQTVSTGNYADYTGDWIIGTLDAGGVAVLEMTWFTLTGTVPITNWAQVKTANPVDSDSTPGNGSCCTSNEDDEAVLVIAPAATLNEANDAQSKEQFKNLVIEKLFPNPATDRVQLYLTSLFDNQNIQLYVYDLFGKQVLQKEINLVEGFNRVSLDIHSFPAGTYNIVLSDNSRQRNIRFVKIRL